MKKTKICMILFLFMVIVANVSLASYNTVSMTVPEEPVCTINMGSQSKFEKKLISKDLSNKEVTLQLQVTNNEVATKPTGEIMLVIDNSESMTETVSGISREQLVIQSAQTLIMSLLKDNTSLKIGAVSFSSTTDVSKEGTLEDAHLVSELTSDATALGSAISNIESNGPRTDLEAGLELASQHFSKTSNNKYLIILTDGVPNVALGENKLYYSDVVFTKTKAKLQALQTSGMKIITMLSGITDETYVPINTTKNFGQIIAEIFGTSTTPTVGSFYYVQDNEIENTITSKIYGELAPNSASLKDITIVDYFPEEIVKNFEFAYVSKATVGSISEKIDTSNSSITWTIPELASGQTAIVQYKLKLKQDYDATIVGKLLNTNAKIDLSYTDIKGEKMTQTSNVSPKIKLSEPPAVLPKAGMTIMIGLCSVALIILIVSLAKYLKIKNDMKN